MESVNKIIQDKLIGHQVGLLRLSSGIINKLVTLLNKTEDDLISQLSRLDNARLNTVLKDIREVLNAAKSGEYNMLQKELTDLVEYEPKYVEQLIKGAIPVKFNMTMPSTDMLSSIVTSQPFQGKLLKEWIDELSDSRRKMVRDAVRMGMVEGQTISQIAQRIRGTRVNQYKDGLMEISRRGAQAMVRTAVNHTATNARELMYAKNEDLISEVQWVSTLDARTTPYCQSMDGKTFPVNAGPRPPGHINCRSTTVPVVKSFRELGFDIDEAPPGTRASMDGQVPEKMTYNDWLKGQSKEMQDSILGPSRGEMFRNGVSVDKFVDINTGKPFTLKQLAEMDGMKAYKIPVFNALGAIDSKDMSAFFTKDVLPDDFFTSKQPSAVMSKLFGKKIAEKVALPQEDAASLLKMHVEKELRIGLEKLPSAEYEAYQYFSKSFLPKALETEIQRTAEAELIHTWAATSSNSHPVSLYLQRMAQKEFGLMSSTISHFSEYGVRELDEFLLKFDQGKLEKGARAFLRTMYNNTQVEFKKAGISELTLFRGQRIKAEALQNLKIGEVLKTDIQLQPISSFSSDVEVARLFASMGAYDDSARTVLVSKVSVERILSSPRTGFGCYKESEFVVLGGKDDALVFLSQDREIDIFDLPDEGITLPTGNSLLKLFKDFMEND